MSGKDFIKKKKKKQTANLILYKTLRNSILFFPFVLGHLY